MQAAKASSCVNHEILKARLRADLRVYADAVAELEGNVGRGFEKAHKKAEHARLAYQAARQKLKDHIESHDCA